MRLLDEPGVCDCHSHVYGPFGRFPLAETRSFTPNESTIEKLEIVWSALGIDRAVLIQGSAYGYDQSALLHAIARDPSRRRGIAIVPRSITDAELSQLHVAGIRGIRFNWVRHLLGEAYSNRAERLAEAAELLERVSVFGWHAEIHIDAQDIGLIRQLDVPRGMAVLIDHMGRPDAASVDYPMQWTNVLELLDYDFVWIKLSGADRMTSCTDQLRRAVPLMRSITHKASERCVWGLDWPHVNLATPRADAELARLLLEVAEDESTLRKILVSNPMKLYGFCS